MYKFLQHPNFEQIMGTITEFCYFHLILASIKPDNFRISWKCVNSLFNII